MKEVSQSELSRNKLYILYWMTAKERLKVLYFFKFLEFFEDGADTFKAMSYGGVFQHGVSRNCFEDYHRDEDFLPLNSEHGCGRFFEINMGEFVQHVSVNTI